MKKGKEALIVSDILRKGNFLFVLLLRKFRPEVFYQLLLYYVYYTVIVVGVFKGESVGPLNLLVSILGGLPNYTYISTHLLKKSCKWQLGCFQREVWIFPSSL